jgi:hypothetical protein
MRRRLETACAVQLRPAMENEFKQRLKRRRQRRVCKLSLDAQPHRAKEDDDGLRR